MATSSKPSDADTQPPSIAKQQSYMTSTWWKDPSRFKPFSLETFLYKASYRGPQTPRSGKLPRWTTLEQSAFILPLASIPVVMQYISMAYYGHAWPVYLAYLVYLPSLLVVIRTTTFKLSTLCAKHGFLDSSRPRDQIPDIRITKHALTMFAVLFTRPAIGLALKYDPNEVPSFSIWSPLQLTMFLIAIDLYFYVYHRATHEIDFLWKYHRTHHLTKHPTTVFTIFADEEQDLIEILIIPVLATLTIPSMNFHTWWFSSIYLIFTELMGHSGLRMYSSTPNPASWFLSFLDMDLIIEDHDLHHRSGWRKSFNYGKQTRIFDKLFGTTRPRVEATPDNIEW